MSGGIMEGVQLVLTEYGIGEEYVSNCQEGRCNGLNYSSRKNFFTKLITNFMSEVKNKLYCIGILSPVDKMFEITEE